ncbi:MAG: single-stranded DNA-binding protein [Ruminococcus flavefaciens]|nr:single-stranded DNA-binding protein [Ruminococcus flavefaciens]
MNKVELVGRLTRDPETRYTQGENSSAIARFSVAVNRRFKNAEGNYDADFINCVAFGKTAEFIEKYFKKGMAIGISGRIQTGNYTNKDGVKVYTTDVVVEEAEFVESKNSGGASAPSNAPANSNTSSADGFMNIPDGIDEELPFN